MKKSEKHTPRSIVETPATDNQHSPHAAASFEGDINAASKNSTQESGRQQEQPYESSNTGAAGLSVILGYMVTYFSNRADVDDLDVLSFSLHHLFCQIDHLYCHMIPQLLASPAPFIAEQASQEQLLHHLTTWTNLRTITYALGRMEPLCNLLSDATRCMLNALDTTDTSFASKSSETCVREQNIEPEWLQALNDNHWQQALATLTACLHSWQEYAHQSLLFANAFLQVPPSIIAMLPQVDEAFSIILDSFGAIFGDILPNFQAISTGDDEVVASLLFDLMQQADRLLLQFDLLMEPLHSLIEHFALPLHH